VDRIKDQTVKDEYREILAQQLYPQSSNDIEVKWKVMKQTIHTATEEVLGTTQPKTMNGWFDQDCQTTLNVNK
jgi:hypothetical protein